MNGVAVGGGVGAFDPDDRARDEVTAANDSDSCPPMAKHEKRRDQSQRVDTFELRFGDELIATPGREEQEHGAHRRKPHSDSPDDQQRKRRAAPSLQGDGCGNPASRQALLADRVGHLSSDQVSREQSSDDSDGADDGTSRLFGIGAFDRVRGAAGHVGVVDDRTADRDGVLEQQSPSLLVEAIAAISIGGLGTPGAAPCQDSADTELQLEIRDHRQVVERRSEQERATDFALTLITA